MILKFRHLTQRDNVYLIFLPFNTNYSLFPHAHAQLQKQMDVEGSDKINLLSSSLLTEMGQGESKAEQMFHT